jgi:hypothetical protein
MSDTDTASPHLLENPERSRPGAPARVLPAPLAHTILARSGWTHTHDGIAVLDMVDPATGEKGGFLVLGHHRDSARVVAAMNAAAEELYRWESLLEEPASPQDLQQAQADLCQGWAVLAPHEDHDLDHDLDRAPLTRMWLHECLTQDSSGAVAVTTWGL